MKNRGRRSKAIKEMEIFRCLVRLLPRTGRSTKEMNWRMTQSLAFKGQKFPGGKGRGRKGQSCCIKLSFSYFLQMSGILTKGMRKRSTQPLHLSSPLPVTPQGSSGMGEVCEEAGNMMEPLSSL